MVSGWKLSLESHKILKSPMLSPKLLLCVHSHSFRNEAESERDAKVKVHLCSGQWGKRKKEKRLREILAATRLRLD